MNEDLKKAFREMEEILMGYDAEDPFAKRLLELEVYIKQIVMFELIIKSEEYENKAKKEG